MHPSLQDLLARCVRPNSYRSPLPHINHNHRPRLVLISTHHFFRSFFGHWCFFVYDSSTHCYPAWMVYQQQPTQHGCMATIFEAAILPATERMHRRLRIRFLWKPGGPLSWWGIRCPFGTSSMAQNLQLYLSPCNCEIQVKSFSLRSSRDSVTMWLFLPEVLHTQVSLRWRSPQLVKL